MTKDGRNRIIKSRRIRTLKEKEIYKYLGILKVDTIKQVEMGKKGKRVSQENEKTIRNQSP